MQSFSMVHGSLEGIYGRMVILGWSPRTQQAEREEGRENDKDDVPLSFSLSTDDNKRNNTRMEAAVPT